MQIYAKRGYKMEEKKKKRKKETKWRKRKDKRRQDEMCLFHQANANICEKRTQNGGKEKNKEKVDERKSVCSTKQMQIYPKRGYTMEEKKKGYKMEEKKKEMKK